MATGTTHRYNFGFHVLNNDRRRPITVYYRVPNSSETTYYVQGHIIGVEI